MEPEFGKMHVTVLCEDIAHYDFIRTYLTELGVQPRNVKRNPKAHNNGTVKSQYPKAMTSLPKQDRNKKYFLIVMTDSDNMTFEEKQAEFDGVAARSERTLRFFPTRNIESWLYFIDSGNTDAETLEISKSTQGSIKLEAPDFKSQYRKKASQFSKKLKLEICPNGLPEDAPASLLDACQELKRLH